MSTPDSVYHIDWATPLLGSETLNLVSGSSFIVCSRDGWIRPGGLQGYFSGDSRMLSTLLMRVDGQPPVALQEEISDQGVVVTSIVGDPSRPALLVRHALLLSDILCLHVQIENLSAGPQRTHVELQAASDFADIFEVKRGQRARDGFVGSGPSMGDLILSFESGEFRRGLRIASDRDHHVLRDGIELNLSIGPHEREDVHFTLVPEADRYTRLNDRRRDRAGTSMQLPNLLDCEDWLVRQVLQRSAADIDALRMIDPLQPDRPVIAAGSPWYLALFGRDSLITAWQTLHLDSEIALNVLESLAHRQGQAVREETEEQPGRILHEVRSGEAVRKAWGSTYYGSVDATPLFVMVLAAAHRTGADRRRIAALLPAAERCLQWMEDYGDLDGDGLIEFPGRAPGVGLGNQAWKDSADAVRHRDGSLAQGPIAMVEVQGYLHRALLDMAELRDFFGTSDSRDLRSRASGLQQQIHEQFWMPDERCFALALDGRKSQVASVSTNAGHLLWTGTVLEEYVPTLCERLMDPDMFSGFGLRTLSAHNPGYNPMSYHCGSVWPHDSALVAQGLFEHGLRELGARLAQALFDAADESTGRLPELFGGFERDRFPRPVPYPASCSPQAWSAGAPLLLARYLM